MNPLLKKHHVLLRDNVRMDAYRRAIRAIVHPGDVVADLGTGTGVLAFEALAAGARHVHAVEVDRTTLALAKTEAAHRGFVDRITFYGGLSQRVRPKELADVVITETLGNFGLNENILAVLADARKRWLKPGGRMIPTAIALTVVPLGRKPKMGRYLQGGLVSVRLHSRDFLGAPITLPRLHLSSPRPLQGERGAIYEANCTFIIHRPGHLTGFGGWFTVWLTPTTSFTTAPGAPATHWQQAMLPLRVPIPVRKGQRIRFWLQIAPDHTGLHSIVSYDVAMVSPQSPG
ncbi:MAG: 50S ribosomal protein L11 methyltransferase [Deltaproteobacteria bacterium]|nr:50S ribosomal protein L11 methyltransferase [Deltaproteobacteria bacterium]